ncbi:hypothetical protein RSOLAG22IIIB_06823 [Rhizoctonia solani]|uniref:Protein kinase domain-containing protein n=1 Tax=Rhizoctonia solani TaxID=456999 RepID=A0A0K6GH89_9AGAM|nr:hypothetical protein RSOLAG22IIIB_06823 [Rhizoctonia solani]
MHQLNSRTPLHSPTDCIAASQSVGAISSPQAESSRRICSIDSDPSYTTRTSPENAEVSNPILLDSRPCLATIQEQDHVARPNNLDTTNSGIPKPNPGRGKGSAKQTRPKVREEEHPDRSDKPTKDIPIIGQQTSLADMIKALTERGCQDLSKTLDPATFSDYPLYHGGFSDVYHRLLEGGRQVAVKTLRISADSVHDSKHLKRAARELHTWNSCQHPNVLPLLGLAVFRGRIGMVSPWMESGNLQRYLNSSEDVDRCNLCTQICDGLAYLHKIDIANVLVLRDGTPVLSDFGNATILGRSLQFTETTQRPSWSIRWAAPELLHESDEQSEAADVYALGMASLTIHHKYSNIDPTIAMKSRYRLYLKS